MDESNAIIGIFLITALSATTYFVLSTGGTGALAQPYLSCCCNILTGDGQQALVRSQIQTFEPNCENACKRYSKEGKVFSQEGLCIYNP